MKLFFHSRAVGLLPLCALALVTLILRPELAQALPQDGQVFQDWTARCETDPSDASVKRCYIVQAVVAGEQRQRVMLMAVAYPPGQETPLATAILPLGTDLRPGIEVAIDDGEPKRYPFSVCMADGCQAHMPLDAALLAAFKKGVGGSVAFLRGPDRRALKVPFSLKGFTAAVNALK
ncbi:MAG: invasion associated locus B family protein [Rhodospirillales bacterium]|nr:invasion associated locus B family protein [Rhodospirillales bacterium]MDH3790921.1 invasion associated locus B family protein [Rhodospirillales bacterium]MDH3913108.1 invasion associated locus B family protein [Rhodospirillales bacterium]MDH3920195.1 invasion associated locus B family protein [Rhodospirillales bacterium]MDH3968113.1 invasion associated locus B family protein [Rhodospirillales bacterium]